MDYIITVETKLFKDQFMIELARRTVIIRYNTFFGMMERMIDVEAFFGRLRSLTKDYKAKLDFLPQQ